MAIRPQPMLYRCPKCGWNEVYAPSSDALLQLPWEECPKCGCEELERKPAGVMDIFCEKVKLKHKNF